MKKQVNVQVTEGGYKYITIYEVRAKKHDGEVVTEDRYLNEDDAKKDLEFARDHLKSLYKTVWIRKHMVWC